MDLGFSIPIIVLGALEALTALVQVVRTRQHYTRYTFVFLAAIFSFIRRITYVAAIDDGTWDLDIVKGNMARTFLYQMFVPFLYCAFFATCQNMITSTTTVDTAMPTTRMTSTKIYYARKLTGTILAYLWTLVLIIVNIAYCAVFARNFPMLNSSLTQQLLSMSGITTHGTWAYTAFAILQLVSGWNQLRRYSVSLLLYLGIVLIATIGMTVSTALSSNVSTIDDEFTQRTISFVLVELVGLLGLFYALFASIQYWQNISAPASPSSLRNSYNQQQVKNFDDCYAPDSKLSPTDVAHEMHHLEDVSQKSMVSSTSGATAYQQMDQRPITHVV
ncbi:hypothetical protein BDB00DRAFT_934102 [Zychaea mexicana]|uniref:uncharacterized protein n=1 Tax=Zychaea mexicana TaxID=64656 RepID=UPI0022FEA87E|nr:uncharacterized protein BDB00DRAFT_934102 [Zychaea mexicana]KAI9477146.1 hypothetical protein BDB00DRAFT_934102 [Zychaea mexicana]